MQSDHQAVQYVRLAREIRERCPDSQIRILTRPHKIMFRWEQQLSDDNVYVWDRPINNRFQWLELLKQMEAIDTIDREGTHNG